MPAPAVRKATMADIDTIAGVVARAFEDDPIWMYLFPQRRFLERAALYTAYELRHQYMPNDETWVTSDGIKGTAVWAPPNKWRQPISGAFSALPTIVRSIGYKLPRAFAALQVIEKAHPPGDHYYLSILSTDPAHQGTGVGSAVLQPVLDRCDAQGMGAYLESSKEKNIPFYNRHGFEVTREIELPRGGPSCWGMWREPRS